MSENSIETMDDYKDAIDNSFRRIKAGDIIKGVVISVDDNEVWFDIGTHIQGVMPREEASADPKFSMKASIESGMEMQLVVIAEDDGTGRVILSKKKADSIFSWDKLYEYFEDQTELEVKVSGIVNKGVVAYIEGIRGFIPQSQLSLIYTEDPEEFLNRTLTVRIITIDRDKQKLVFSARVIEEAKAADEKDRKMKSLVPGVILKGTVDSIMPFGAFIKLENGLSGLCHISQICNKRIQNVKEVLKEGDEVLVKLLKIDEGKISLSIKDAMDMEGASDIEDDEFEYKEEGSAATSLGSLLSGFKFPI